MSKLRLDVLLVERGLFESRAQAAASVIAGEVMLLPDRRRALKPGQMISDESQFEVDRPAEFVSRGGIKLANALDAFDLDVTGANALDVGASTGGFTDCLLQRGAEHVVSLDVAYGEFSWKLREDPRVTVIERRNARQMQPGDLPYAPGLIVIDISFISVTKVLSAVLACAAPRFDCLAMIKPQFEVGRERIGKGGVVREASYRREALLTVARYAQELGVGVTGFASSGLAGPKGNLETFLRITEAGRTEAVEIDIETAALAVEP